MKPAERHLFKPHVSFDGGELDCGNGLLLLIRKHLDLLEPGQLIEILSQESSVDEDLPAWCRLTKNELVSWTKVEKQRSFLVARGSFSPGLQSTGAEDSASPSSSLAGTTKEKTVSSTAVIPFTAHFSFPALTVTGIGSWPRPRWLLKALHEYLEGKLTEEEFQETANDAVRLAVQSQLSAGCDLITDGEQRRDNYASFVGSRLENCQLIPLVDLLPLVDHPEEFEKQLSSLDVPASQVRHPAVFGKLKRKNTLAVHELQFVAGLTDKPVKIALPGPYLLTRTMWLECIADKAYQTREELAADIVAILRAEIEELLAQGAALIQLDEPVLTEVVFTDPAKTTRFMCGALSAGGDKNSELNFAQDLLRMTLAGFPAERMALHVCRGNWSPDESVALSGDYDPLLPLLNEVAVGTLFLEFSTPRAGDIEILKKIADKRIGLGTVNQKHCQLETQGQISEKIKRAIKLIGKDRLFLNPDCGFATFADNPVASAATAQAKLAALVSARNSIGS